MAKVIAGLGNPGQKYEGTRHNIGFMVIDSLAEHYGLNFKNGYDGLVAQADIAGSRVYFLKPQTFMNLSGVSVAAIMRFYKIELDDLLLVHDEMNIPFGKVKLRRDGSAGGHNGLSSIIASLGTDKFPRLKMGIDRKAGTDAVSHVLGMFNPEEKKGLEEFISMGTNAVVSVIESGLSDSMAKFNR